MSHAYRTEIETAAAAHGLDPNLVQAIVEQESSYRFYAYRYESAFFTTYLAHDPRYADRNPYEVSASIGLMQVMFATAVDYGFTGQPWELFAPAVSLEFGCRVLADLLVWARGQFTGLAVNEQASMRRLALAAYNGGKGNARKSVPQQYALAVLQRYDRIRKAP